MIDNNATIVLNAVRYDIPHGRHAQPRSHGSKAPLVDVKRPDGRYILEKNEHAIPLGAKERFIIGQLVRFKPVSSPRIPAK